MGNRTESSSEVSGHEIAWERKGRTMTREEYDRQTAAPRPSPSGGSRLTARIAVSDDDAWKQDAACRGKPTRWWFPESNESWSATAVLARHICSTCPVAETCRAVALARHEYGIWGTGQRARAMERRQQPKPPPKPAKQPKPLRPASRPLSALSVAILASLADGPKHLDEIVEQVRGSIDEGQARRRQSGVLRRRHRHVAPGDLGPSGVRAGQRHVVRDALNTLMRHGYVERADMNVWTTKGQP